MEERQPIKQSSVFEARFSSNACDIYRQKLFRGIEFRPQHARMKPDVRDYRRIMERRNALFFKKTPMGTPVIAKMEAIEKRALLWRIDCESAYLASLEDPLIYFMLLCVMKTWSANQLIM